MKKWADQMDALLIDTDRLLSCETNFSIGKWIDDARSFGKTEAEKEYYEENHYAKHNSTANTTNDIPNPVLGCSANFFGVNNHAEFL